MVTQETEITSWSSRLQNSIKGIIGGFILILVGIGLLFWNEGKAVRVYKSIERSKEMVVSLDKPKVLPKNEGKLVHLIGEINLPQDDFMLEDDVFGLKFPVMKLSREVEMYQWKEIQETKKEKLTGGKEKKVTTYKYQKRWSSSEIDSQKFKESSKYHNPQKVYNSSGKDMPKFKMGDFTLSNSLTFRISNYKPLSFKKEDLNFENDYDLEFHVTDNTIYIGKDPSNPQIGDLKVNFYGVFPGPYSILAQQSQDTLTAYNFEDIDEAVLILKPGKKTAKALLAEQSSNASKLKWILRLIGFLLIAFGLSLILKPLSVVADVIPIIGSFVEGINSLVSLLIALGLSLFVIAVSWVVHRPVFGIGLLILSILAFTLYILRQKEKLPSFLEPILGKKKVVQNQNPASQTKV